MPMYKHIYILMKLFQSFTVRNTMKLSQVKLISVSVTREKQFRGLPTENR